MQHPAPIAESILTIATRLAIDEGIYVEAGANDGIRQSNTLLLNQVGWTGVLIEPSPVAFDRLVVNRPDDLLVQCALVADAGTSQVTGTFAAGSLMASADGELRYSSAEPSRFRGEARIRRALGLSPRGSISVPSRTLADVLRDAGVRRVDLLSLDVEGQELAALIGLGNELRPRLLVIETRRRDALAMAELLLGRGYVLVANLSAFSHERNPGWSGDHQDLVWCIAEDSTAIGVVHDVAWNAAGAGLP